MTRKVIIAAISIALFAGVGTWYVLSDSSGSHAISSLDPASFAELKNEFNAAAGHVRIIALLSPT
jgi:hypothetical protein